VIRELNRAAASRRRSADLAQLPVRHDELDVARLGRRTGDEVEVRTVDVGVAARVHNDLVRPLPGARGCQHHGWLACLPAVTRCVARGYCEEDFGVWDSADTLIA
jgi:hypothetical protein